MIKYVAGFLFDDERSKVVLIEKQKPTWQAGCHNAVGGKIEAGEDAAEAMRREFIEETGLVFPQWSAKHPGWEQFCVLMDSNLTWQVTFFRAFLPAEVVEQVTTRETEKVGVFQLAQLKDIKRMTNLAWLAEMALSMDKERAKSFSVVEIAKYETRD